jgi:Hint domain
MPIGCYAAGTRIRTKHGEIAVEHVSPGDRLATLRDGQVSYGTVTWVGYRHHEITRDPNREESAPIRIRRDAVADGQPNRDLFVSPEHCLFLDGKLIPAKLLVNGVTLVQERQTAAVTYYHLELERHSVLLADGLPAESYLDTGNRDVFSNSDVPTLHPQFAVNYDATRWDTDAAAPLARDPVEIERIWQRLIDRAEAMGYGRRAIKTTTAPDIHVVAAGQTVRPVVDTDNRYVFVLPRGAASAILVSRFGIPADMATFSPDTRRLGVRVSWIAMQADDEETVIPIDHPALRQGWQAVERSGASLWRWTDGNAQLPVTGTPQQVVITVRCEPLDQYPLYDANLMCLAA